ncbi:MAG: hypothetical protein ACI8PB_004048 [Desulforhopalus sp.]|jgi:hypothetical protein
MGDIGTDPMSELKVEPLNPTQIADPINPVLFCVVSPTCYLHHLQTHT